MSEERSREEETESTKGTKDDRTEGPVTTGPWYSKVPEVAVTPDPSTGAAITEVVLGPCNSAIVLLQCASQR